MYSTALSVSLPSLSTKQQESLLTDTAWLRVYEAFAAVPDPRSKHGQRYDHTKPLEERTCVLSSSYFRGDYSRLSNII